MNCIPITLVLTLSLASALPTTRSASPLAAPLSAASLPGEETSQTRWKAWRKDLNYLFDEIEKPSTLKSILKAKGISWKKVKKEANGRFNAHAKAFRKNKQSKAPEERVAFYGILRYTIGQLRDTHAHLKVADSISKAWQDSLPKTFDAGIEFQPGSQGLILVSNTFAARGANSPLMAKGVHHEATYLASINGKPSTKYFQELATKIYGEDGWQSTYGRAWIESMNALTLPEKGTLKLVFKTLDLSEKARDRYLQTPDEDRAKAFRKLKWDTKKVSLRANECERSKNARNFIFMALRNEDMTATSDKGIWYTKLPSGYGLIKYYSVNQNSRAAMDQACEALSDCPGIILDMRSNGGGGNSGVDTFHNKTGAWTKPLAVLAGHKTMSQGETEIWRLQQFRKAKKCTLRIFGQTTAGSSGAKIQFALPSGFAKGQFVFRHWEGRDGPIEGNGIAPDQEVFQDIVELSAGIDSHILRAERWMDSL